MVMRESVILHGILLTLYVIALQTCSLCSRLTMLFGTRQELLKISGYVINKFINYFRSFDRVHYHHFLSLWFYNNSTCNNLFVYYYITGR